MENYSLETENVYVLLAGTKIVFAYLAQVYGFEKCNSPVRFGRGFCLAPARCSLSDRALEIPNDFL